MPKLLPIAPAGITWRMLFASMMETPWQVALITALFITNALLALVTPWQIGKIIDAAIAGELHNFPWNRLLLIALATIISAIVTRAWIFQAQVLGTRINQDLGIDLIASSLDLDAQTIEDAGGGDLVSRITDDLDSIRRVVTEGIPELAAITINIITIAASIFFLSPTLGLMTLPMFICQAIALTYFLPRIAKYVTIRTQKSSNLTTTATENIRGAATINELGITTYRKQTLDTAIQQHFIVQDGLVRLRSWFWAIDSLIAYTPLILAITWGTYTVHQGWTTWVMISTAAILVFNMRTNADIFSFWLNTVRELTVTMGRISGVINLANQHRARREAQKIEMAQHTTSFAAVNTQTNTAVRIKNMSFGYHADTPVMQDIDLEIPAGESIALIGRSGSGKTTLARLIAGSLTATTGSIHVMGQRVGLGDFPTEPAWDGRPKLLICTQEAHLFIGTIAENMTVAAPSVTSADIEKALDAVGATWWRDLPAGIETVVGLGNYELTRDHIQQLALARILVANPHVVILDESTTQLELADATESMRAIMAGRTVIIISHDSRIANLADRHIFLADGHIADDVPVG